MKVDANIVSGSSGTFSKKEVHDLQFTIVLTDTEKATIKKAGLINYVIINGLTDSDVNHTIAPWVNGTVRGNGSSKRPTLIQAQAVLQELKGNLTQLKQAIDLSNNAPTRDSFEI